uniref:Uncharacterized protein n=1 Tax=Candidatus Kentrum eta TaxID=2126337 RepID=A0A450VJ41_9GAMM|nr:MAG: hypothetical protein BECKH772A_GA0070896_102101 [Candidatus Kentron sp. H]VFK01021.1 MAG: hypothetical protein BECKH772B_GA0070898_102151 [Candidatus Kentron sp. H]VFK04822.1 MAG: hypothetical protein BECKH772C_GA0070978_102114 [Candidatus Kentron sp. H]
MPTPHWQPYMPFAVIMAFLVGIAPLFAKVMRSPPGVTVLIGSRTPDDMTPFIGFYLIG